MQEAVEQKARDTRFTLFLLSLLCFVLPFISISSPDRSTTSITGVRLVAGIKAEHSSPNENAKQGRAGGEPLAAGMMLCVFIGLISCFAPGSAGKLIPAIAGAGGLLSAVMLKVHLSHEIEKVAAGQFEIRYAFGLIVSGFFLLLGVIVSVLHVCHSLSPTPGTSKGSSPRPLTVLFRATLAGCIVALIAGGAFVLLGAKTNVVPPNVLSRVWPQQGEIQPGRQAIPQSVEAPAKAQEPQTAEALLDRVLDAYGGEERQKQFKAFRITQEGKMWIRAGEPPIAYSFEQFYQHPGQIKQTITYDQRGRQNQQEFGCSGGACWERRNGRLVAPRDEVKQQLWSAMQLAALGLVFPLRDGYRQVELCEPLRVDGQVLPGLLLKTPGEEDAELYFDPQTYVLVFCQLRVD